ncbi:hypothetical protein M4D81_19975 [Paenibacillus sp. p3-SID867]|uniref:hypothetical protein n=1 Tax=Paenibacillus sp. p3-SID867 TaxID=2916363 RepID=UPI0021A3F4CB|nr:hypothetical protein [Paenibacillus sp. p3-SID867]MCT1401302.1 hypothetical protein [Paenibacillus sp. p3-SID867]
MNPRLSAFIKISMFVMVLSLTACSGTAEPPASPEISTPANEEATAPETDNEQAPEVTRPQNENFELMTGEGNQSLPATLHQGKGFSLYVFEKFAFDADKGRLFLSGNPEYEVTIEALPANYDLTKLKTEGNKELEERGEVSDFSGELVEHPLGSAELYLQASGSEGINDYMVWKSETGDAFLFRLHNPKGEEASDFAGPVLVSLSTVKSDS